MKGGARLTLDLEGWCEGWCAIETWPWRVVRDWERVVRDWHVTLKGGVKGGVRLRLDLEGWCAIEKGWCAIESWPWRVVWRVVCDWDLTLKGGARLRLDLEGWCAIETWSWRVVCDWDLTLTGGARLRVDLEGWCEGWCAIETWPWRVVRDWDLTLKGGVRLRLDLEGWCAIETWPWRVVRDWELTLKGGVRLHMTLMKGGCRSDWDLTLKGAARLRLDLEGWCAIETWPWWRVVADRIVMAAWMLHGLCFGEEAGARNLVFFRVKWLQATMKGTSCVRRVRLRSFRTRLVSSMCFVTSGCSCGIVLCVSWSCGCRSHCNGSMNVAWSMFWGGSRSTKPCVFPCKVAAGDDERYLVCATGAAAVVPDAIGSFYVFCNKWLFLWCSSMRFLKLWLQIAL